MSDPAALLHSYDSQLRRHAEVSDAVRLEECGPLLLATFVGGHGLITYRDLEAVPKGGLDDLVAQAVDRFEARLEIRRVEWKTRGHDRAPGLHEALLRHGFVPDEPESVMVGDARLLAVDVDLPDGVGLRKITGDDDIRRMAAMQAEVFGDDPEEAEEHLRQLLHRMHTASDIELWVAEADGDIVTAGRLEPVEGTEFAGIWGGATRSPWRGRGIYRALTAARARSALTHGKRYLHSDSTEFSRPILERSGLVKVSITTPYEWRRDRE